VFADMLRAVRVGAAAALLCGAVGCATTHKTEAQRQADQAMTRQVESALASDKQLFSRHITVHADDGVVRLTGFVWDPPDIVEATRIAESVPGVTRVVNALELQRNGVDNSPVSR